jgi:hypothetical protein
MLLKKVDTGGHVKEVYHLNFLNPFYFVPEGEIAEKIPYKDQAHEHDKVANQPG